MPEVYVKVLEQHSRLMERHIDAISLRLKQATAAALDLKESDVSVFVESVLGGDNIGPIHIRAYASYSSERLEKIFLWRSSLIIACRSLGEEPDVTSPDVARLFQGEKADVWAMMPYGAWGLVNPQPETE